MFQVMPSFEHYKNLKRDWLNKGQKTYFTEAELAKEQLDENFYKAGGSTYTDYKLTSHDAICLNRWTKEINRTTDLALREYFKDRQHQEFCIYAEELTPDEIFKRGIEAEAKLQNAQQKKSNQ